MAEFVAYLEWLPQPAVALLIFLVFGGIALLIHHFLFKAVMRATAKYDLFWRSLVSRTKGPTRMATLVIGFMWAASVAPIGGFAALVSQTLNVLLILLGAWIIKTAVHIWSTLHLRRFKLDAEDNLLARKHATQTRILLKVFNILVYMVALSLALMTFDDVRQLGLSILASAGVAGIVLGLALQPVLKNLLAGIQLAITQPIRIDDALLVEGEWGNVEEITATYVVVRIWDLRRLILPLSYFMENPFQNWTREGAALLGNVMIYLDYRAPIERIRSKVEEITASSPLWDGKVAVTQVTDFREQVMEVRILVSASNAGRAFDLRCLVREQLVDFLQKEHPQALPHMRHLALMEQGKGMESPVDAL
ncbi:mechanosensitive ion channel family protein [Pelagibacterium limicola]|uniref:mechanosensitive ion channel family protein n=1 Tax=Pelagibacterium limicola TaxID=2791022 RepID=UPI001FE9DF26|nr:mechanosensitive ion channel family protein [Pelagibacterium limicola]